jgi:hypothetical protein
MRQAMSHCVASYCGAPDLSLRVLDDYSRSDIFCPLAVSSGMSLNRCDWVKVGEA